MHKGMIIPMTGTDSLQSGVRLLLIFAWMFLSGSPASAGQAPSYRISAELDTQQKTLAATEVLSWRNPGPSPVDHMVLHIYPNRRYSQEEQDFMFRYGGYFKINPYPEGFPEKTMDVISVRQQGRGLDYEISGEEATLLTVKLPHPLKKGETAEVEIRFKLFLPHAYGRYGWHENIIKLSRWYPILAVYEKEGWNENPFFPFHRPFFSESSLYDVELTAPADQVVIHTGRKTGEERLGAVKKYRLKTDLPVREFTLALSEDYLLKEDRFGDVRIKSYYLPGDEDAALLAISDVKDLMGFYSELFGPSPYKEFSLAPVHLGYGGEQMGQMAFIDTRVYRLPKFLDKYFDFLISHETGHLWFYNLVGMNEYTQMWLEEGTNAYFNNEYLYSKYGEDADILTYPDWFNGGSVLLPRFTFKQTRMFRYLMLERSGWDHPVVDKLSSFQEPTSIFSITYGKGSRIVGMLEAVIGPETFRKVFQRIFKEYCFKNLELQDFIRICEEESGQDLSMFFEQWLYKAGRYDYAVAGVSGQNIILKNLGDIEMPAPVKVTFADQSTRTFIWDGQQKEQSIPMEGPAPIERVSIDPEETLLDVDRVDNQWPRAFHVNAVPIYWGLYDIPLFLPEDGYNIVIGPESANSGLGLKASLHRPYDWVLYSGTDYEFGEQLLHSRLGYQLKNVFRSQTSAGFELANTHDFDDGDDDLASGKVYLRQELWPAAYGVFKDNDHWTLYLIRNQRLGDRHDAIVKQEEDQYLEYSRREEAIVGAVLHLDRTGPYPDPRQGWGAHAFLESAGHFLGATQYFYRSGFDVRIIEPVSPQTRLALRVKYGWGYPRHKELFHLGGMDGLRGYQRKDVRGANIILGSAEYRFPLLPSLDISVADHLFGIESLGGVIFFDAGQSWMENFSDADFKKDVGAGLRVQVNIGSFLEKITVRLDVAQALGEPQEDTRFWFGLNHAF